MKKIVVIVFAVLLSACDGNAVFSEFTDGFAGNRWEKSNPVSYDFKLEEAGAYDMELDFSHVYQGIPFKSVPVIITVQGPDGIKTENINLNLIDGGGNELGDCSGDLCDSRHDVFRGRRLPAGNYKVMATNNFEHEFLPNVIGVGIRVSKSAQ